MEFAVWDYVILIGYFAVVAFIGFWFGRQEKDTDDFFLGARRQHWIVVGLSIIATELSALTFVNVPADSFRGDFNYFQMYFGSFAGRLIIVALLLPAFYRGAVTSIYEYLGQRFGPYTQAMTSCLFFLSRIIGSGIRLLAASLALAVVSGWDLYTVIIVAAAVVVAYTTFGGIKAVIWTDAFQALIFIGGALGVLIFLFWQIPGNALANLHEAYQAGKFHTFTWDWNPNNVKAFWVLFIFGTFQTVAALGCDQDLTQRMLTCPDVKKGQRSLLLNAFAGWPIVVLFLTIGAMMYVYYGHFPDQHLPAQKDRIFPYFIIHCLPPGLKGLLVAGIFAAAMSSLDSALSAMSSALVIDFYKPYVRRQASDAHYLLVSRLAVLVIGFSLAMVAIAFARYDKLLWEAFAWSGLIFGSMLGIFMLGLTTRRRGSDCTNPFIMLGAILGLVILKFYQEKTHTTLVAWPWWIVIGTLWTYGWGLICPTRQAT